MSTVVKNSKPSSISAKLKKIRAGGPIRTLDLFAGCGGLSLGFHSCGFQIVASVEFDPTAVRSHARNFFGDENGIHGKPIDITETTPTEIIERFGLGKSIASAIDVIIGGPPCQAFARVGRAKLREVDEHPDAVKNDARGNLYLRYLNFVQELQPLAILIENVPDMINYGGHNIAEEVSEVLSGLGYVAKYTLLNSAFFGVPQMRERMFLVAYRKELETEVVFPTPRYHVELPIGYKGSRDVALKALRSDAKRGLFNFDDNHYSAPIETLLFLVMFLLPRPRRIRREMEEFFRFCRTKFALVSKRWRMNSTHLQCSISAIRHCFTI